MLTYERSPLENLSHIRLVLEILRIEKHFIISSLVLLSQRMGFGEQ